MTTHSEAALGCLGLWSTMAYVDKTKLLFFGNLCRASPNLLHKRIFTARLFSALWSETKKSYGFIPDIIRILTKYSLYNYLEIYLESLQFPSKPTWKKLVSERIHHSENTAWREAMVEKPALIHFC